jgi:hypothetical protein
MTQLTLPLQPRRVPTRQLPAIERLRAVLTRQGIDWRYRSTRNSILFRPMFGPHFGWQLMCGRYCCQGAELAFERVAYRELEPATDREDREARLAFLVERRAQIDELWGRP